MFAGWCCFLLSFRRIGRLLGATLHAFPVGEDEPAADAALERRARVLADEGRRPYVIHSAPGHPPLGGLGYVLAAEEVTAQARALGGGRAGWPDRASGGVRRVAPRIVLNLYAKPFASHETAVELVLAVEEDVVPPIGLIWDSNSKLRSSGHPSPPRSKHDRSPRICQ